MNGPTEPNVYRVANLQSQVIEIDLESLECEELRVFGGITNTDLRRIAKKIREMGENEEQSDERTAHAAASIVEEYL